ncbi:MAG: ABC transporter permease [Chloroflexi bacterium]|nr:ABC transporter permease [Chloroflexota bacterium]
MNAFLAILRREVRAVLRERTILIAILIQLFIASFSSALLIGLLSLYDPESIGVYARVNLGIGLLGAPNSALAPILSERGIRVTPYATAEDAQAAYQQGAIDAIIAAPDDGAGPVEMKLFLPRAEAKSSVILMVLQEPFKQYENVLRAQRGIEVRYTDLRGLPPTTFEFIYSIIIPVLMFFPAFVAGSMVVDSLSEELENNTLDTLLTAPLSLNTIVGGKIAAAWLLAFVQCLAWLALLRVNRIAVENVWLVLALAVITAGIITNASAFVSVVFKDRERSQFVYSLLILASTSISYAFDASPIKTMTRLASGDYYTGARDVIGFAVTLVVAIVVLWFGARRVEHAR